MIIRYPADARRQFDARPADFKPEDGNSHANVYAWITGLEKYGEVDRTATADAMFYAVFTKGGEEDAHRVESRARNAHRHFFRRRGGCMQAAQLRVQ